MIRSYLKNGYLLRVMAAHDFRTQYVDSLLGVLWSMLKPLALIGLYALVFSKVITPTVTVDGAPINFGLFLFAGMLPWTAVQESSQRSCTVFTDQSSLVRHHTVPLSMYPLAIVLSSTLSTLVIVLVFILVKVTVSGSFPVLSLLLLPVIPFQVLFCFGISLTVSILNVFIRDISHLTTTVLTVLFFTSPIIFPPGSLPVPVLKLMWLNPLTGYVFLYRDLLLLDRLPSAPTMISVVLVTAASIAAGAALYRRSHRRIVDWA